MSDRTEPGGGLPVTFDAWWQRWEPDAMRHLEDGEKTIHHVYVQAGDGGLHLGALALSDDMQMKLAIWQLVHSTPDPQTVILAIEAWGTVLNPEIPRHRKLYERMQAGRMEVKDLPASLRFDMLLMVGQSVTGQVRIRRWKIVPGRPRTFEPITEPMRAGVSYLPLFPPEGARYALDMLAGDPLKFDELLRFIAAERAN